VRTLAFIVSLLVSGAASAQPGPTDVGIPSNQMPPVLSDVSFDQRLNKRLPLDTAFTDEDGRAVKLGDYFGTKPVVLAFVYYECPMLCSQVLNGLTASLTVLAETVGRDFDVVAISFDPRDTPVTATGKKKAYVDRYRRLGSDNGFHFLTGDEASVRKVTDAAGFKYVWDGKTQQFAHASGIVVATPDGRLARYFFGIEYAPRDVKFALMEASAGRIGSAIDKLLLYCYHYDPASGSYGFVAMGAVRVGGAVTVLALVGFVLVSLSREQRTPRPSTLRPFEDLRVVPSPVEGRQAQGRPEQGRGATRDARSGQADS
jgi:protein SCO1/2